MPATVTPIAPYLTPNGAFVVPFMDEAKLPFPEFEDDCAWPNEQNDGHPHVYGGLGCFCFYCGRDNLSPRHMAMCPDDSHLASGSFLNGIEI